MLCVSAVDVDPWSSVFSLRPIPSSKLVKMARELVEQFALAWKSGSDTVADVLMHPFMMNGAAREGYDLSLTSVPRPISVLSRIMAN